MQSITMFTKYSNYEYFEMVRAYILSGESLPAARRMYQEALPRLRNRGIYEPRIPELSTILSAQQKLIEYGQFTTPRYMIGHGQLGIDAKVQEKIIDFINEHPESSVRSVARRFGVSHSFVASLRDSDESINSAFRLATTQNAGSNVTNTIGSSLKRESKNKTKHKGVTCKCCNNVIVGNRYKCLQCLSVDLCGTCEAANFHSEHVLLRLPTPTIYKTVLPYLEPVKEAILTSLNTSNDTSVSKEVTGKTSNRVGDDCDEDSDTPLSQVKKTSRKRGRPKKTDTARVGIKNSRKSKKRRYQEVKLDNDDIIEIDDDETIEDCPSDLVSDCKDRDRQTESHDPSSEPKELGVVCLDGTTPDETRDNNAETGDVIKVENPEDGDVQAESHDPSSEPTELGVVCLDGTAPDETQDDNAETGDVIKVENPGDVDVQAESHDPSSEPKELGVVCPDETTPDETQDDKAETGDVIKVENPEDGDVQAESHDPSLKPKGVEAVYLRDEMTDQKQDNAETGDLIKVKNPEDGDTQVESHDTLQEPKGLEAVFLRDEKQDDASEEIVKQEIKREDELSDEYEIVLYESDSSLSEI